MKILISILLLGCSSFAAAQQFVLRHDIVLPDSLLTADTRFSDLDGDGLQDIAIWSQVASGSSYIFFIKGDTTTVPLSLTAVVTLGKDVNAFEILDYDHDNALDLVVSTINATMKTGVYINQGAFIFTQHEVIASPFELFKKADLDHDGKPEWIVSGEENGSGFFRILSQTDDFEWSVVHDSLTIQASSFEIVDVNYDGGFDLFITGKANDGGAIHQFMINKGALFFQPYLSGVIRGNTTSGDFTPDGKFDVVISGNESNGNLKSMRFESSGIGYAAVNLPELLNESMPFAADLNSDGQIDVDYQGIRLDSDTVNYIDYPAAKELLPFHHLIDQQFGDLDQDGDLDLLQVTNNVDLHIMIYENNTANVNSFPSRPDNGVAVPVFDRTFFYWDPAVDDHTPVVSLTYDLHIEGGKYYESSTFDLVNEKRFQSTHGNNGTPNFRLIRNKAKDNLTFAVQAIDNSLHGGKICVGNSFTCVDVVSEPLRLCTSEAVTLTSAPNALWFSFANGYIGKHNSYQFSAASTDTLFAYNPAQAGCAGLKLWTVEIQNDTTKTSTSDRYACVGSTLSFEVESGWTNIEWKSTIKGALGSGTVINYEVSVPDTVMVTFSNGKGCVIQRKTAIRISSPDLHVDDESYKIMKGSSVGLMASGGVSYEWTPPTGLNAINVPNPIASPLVSTVYTVTAFDSLGCDQSASVSVEVEEMPFIPNLFTPNADGKNDELKVYGLASVSNFSLTIFNREGAQVFKTTNPAEATQRGWDGTRNGTLQPPGVYFWKVRGQLTSGQSLMLNGKSSGSIVLVR